MGLNFRVRNSQGLECRVQVVGCRDQVVEFRLFVYQLASCAILLGLNGSGCSDLEYIGLDYKVQVVGFRFFVYQLASCAIPLGPKSLRISFLPCCSALQCVAVCCSVLQCVAVCCSVLQCVAVCRSVLQHVAVSCTIPLGFRTRALENLVVALLQCAAMCCSGLQCVTVCYSQLGNFFGI